MKIIAQNTQVLTSSFEWNEAKTEVKFQANTELLVEENPYASNEFNSNYTKPKMVTPVTLFDLVCAKEDLANIEQVAQTQAQAWVDINYPQI